MFSEIDFKNGVITYCEWEDIKKEDLLQVKYGPHVLLDLGWYDTKKAYIIYVIVDFCWENPKIKIHTKNKKDMLQQLQITIDDIVSGNFDI